MFLRRGCNSTASHFHRCEAFSPEDGGSMFLRIFGSYLPVTRNTDVYISVVIFDSQITITIKHKVTFLIKNNFIFSRLQILITHIYSESLIFYLVFCQKINLKQNKLLLL
jgi:hypothetical protein